MQLSDGERDALLNLARKSKGDAVPFINIADARTLTTLGLASRSRAGWEITEEGRAYLLEAGVLAGDAPRSATLHEVSGEEDQASDGGPELRQAWLALRDTLVPQLEGLQWAAMQGQAPTGVAGSDAVAELKRRIRDFDRLMAPPRQS